MNMERKVEGLEKEDINTGNGNINFPDIDIDYKDDRRQEIVEYVKRKYCKDKTVANLCFRHKQQSIPMGMLLITK